LQGKFLKGKISFDRPDQDDPELAYDVSEAAYLATWTQANGKDHLTVTFSHGVS
jgi:hypothetical protein